MPHDVFGGSTNMSELDKIVLDEINKRGIKPKPYVYFLAKRSVFWTLASMSICLGAISVAIALFAMQDFMRTGGRSYSDMPLDETLKNLPLLWVASFGLFVFSAYYGLRNTKRGYRFHPVRVITAASILTVGLGLILHVVDAGQALQNILSAQFPSYANYTYVPYDEWRRPDEGFLGGEVLSVEGVKSLKLRDFDGKEWTVNITASSIVLEDPLDQGGDIAIRGERTGPSEFKAKSIVDFD